jgi:cytochrome c553
MPKHIVRLILIILGFGVVAVTARNYLADKSFYEYGHYRGNAVAEIARDKPKYQGVAYCESCHAAQFAEWSKGVHDSVDIGKVVKCEVCHGPAGGRDPQQGFINAATGPLHPTNMKLVVPIDTRALCTLCHEKMPGRPLQQAQIVIKDHAGTQQCTLCHNPHSPRTLFGSSPPPAHPGTAAAGKDKTAMCAGCHGAEGVGTNLPGPSLAGQNQAYLIEALTAYKTGKRNNPMMTPIAAAVGDGDIGDVAAYFSGLKCESTLNAADQAAAARKAGASVCTNCHGANGIGTNRGWPNLAGQSKDYLANALKAYASGTRLNVVMSALTKGMSDVDVENLAAYYASPSCK